MSVSKNSLRMLRNEKASCRAADLPSQFPVKAVHRIARSGKTGVRAYYRPLKRK
jgi:hypothetical protein